MPEIRSVAVFCGSSRGADERFLEAASVFGRGLGEAGLRLVYGGGHTGMMGAVADAALSAGGQVVGVMPEFLKSREVAHRALTELIITDSMHSRKQRMFSLADAFVSLPGGFGTYDETIEILTWRQLGLHHKPIVLCDVAGAFRPFAAMLESAIELGFAKPEVRDLFEVLPSPKAVLSRLATLPAAAPTTAEVL